jgi:hypothetical protein
MDSGVQVMCSDKDGSSYEVQAVRWNVLVNSDILVGVENLTVIAKLMSKLKLLQSKKKKNMGVAVVVGRMVCLSYYTNNLILLEHFGLAQTRMASAAIDFAAAVFQFFLVDNCSNMRISFETGVGGTDDKTVIKELM